MEKEMEIKMSIHDALDTLNPMQREAAVHTEGPLREISRKLMMAPTEKRNG